MAAAAQAVPQAGAGARPRADPGAAVAVPQPGARAAARVAARSARLVAALVALGLVAPPDFLARLTVFALACVVGWQVIWNVTPALHTPLMSVTNAISGIIVIGGMLQIERAARARRWWCWARRPSCWRPSTSPADSW